MVAKGSNARSTWMESWKAMKAVIVVPTFQVIALQGIIGSLPWTAMVFFTMWFELIGEVLCSSALGNSYENLEFEANNAS